MSYRCILRLNLKGEKKPDSFYQEDLNPGPPTEFTVHPTITKIASKVDQAVCTAVENQLAEK